MIAALVAGILQRFKQPVIIGHILTGLVVGPFLFRNSQIKDIIDSLSQIGIALLLFIIGLNLSPKVIKEVGKVSFFSGLGQIIVTAVVGFFVAKFLHIPTVPAIFLSLALTFSSTIIIMKLLSDKRDLNKFYSKISIGLLLVQDFVVAVMLIMITAFHNGSTDWQSILSTVLKGVIVFDLIIIFVLYVLPTFSASFAKSQEFLFLFAIGWGLGIAALFHELGFSMEIGALVAGVALSTSPFHYEISSRLKPLRDFFVILFFVLLGSRINLQEARLVWSQAVVFSLFVLIVKPLIVTVLTGLNGYRRKINFMSSVNFSQISEFSLIFLLLMQQMGYISSSQITLITVVSLMTIALSSYIVIYADKLYPLVQKVIFERKEAHSGRTKNECFDVILFGCNRVGSDFVDQFKDLKEKFLVVDYDPEKIAKLQASGVACRYGDADDNEFLDELNFAETKMIISTIPSFETNEFIIGRIRLLNKESVIIAISHDAEEAICLYEAGATYVITPHFLGGQYASMLISKYGFDVEKFVTEKEKHLKDLAKRKDFAEPMVLPEIYK